eukprot:11617570-Heterocapsa_arctica.AAC.1
MCPTAMGTTQGPRSPLSDPAEHGFLALGGTATECPQVAEDFFNDTAISSIDASGDHTPRLLRRAGVQGEWPRAGSSCWSTGS